MSLGAIRSAAKAAATEMSIPARTPANALSMQECSAKCKAAKEAGTLKGMKWNAQSAMRGRCYSRTRACTRAAARSLRPSIRTAYRTRPYSSTPFIPHPLPFQRKGYLLPDFYSGCATGISGRFTEGLLLRRSHKAGPLHPTRLRIALDPTRLPPDFKARDAFAVQRVWKDPTLRRFRRNAAAVSV